MKFSAEIPKVVQIKMGYGGKLLSPVCSVKILASFDHPQKDRNIYFQPDSCQNNKVYPVQICSAVYSLSSDRNG